MTRQCLIALLALASPPALYAQAGSAPHPQRRTLVTHSGRILDRQGLRFKDLNKNGVLDPYEDWRLSPSAAADSLKLEAYSLRTYDGQTHDIELGKLTVPESRVHRTGRTASIAFFRLKSTSPTPGSPIVFLMGGPGIAASVMAPIPPYWQLFDALRTAGDVILLDQRGLGLSSPKVDCPPLAQPLDTNLLTSHAAFIAAYRRVLASCAAHWRSKDVDPRAFTDAEIADDVDDIRRALGAQRVSLLGFSYGTRLAMTFARRHPDRLDRIVLQGPTDPDLEYRESLTYDLLLARLAHLAAADTVSAPYSADLFARTKALFARADREPIALKIRRTSGDSVSVRVSGDVLRGLVGGHVTDVRLPALVATMERGDNTILTRWVEGLYNDFNAGAGTLMARAVNCSSAPSDARRARVDVGVARSIFGGAFDNFAADWSFCSALGADSAKAQPHLRAPLESPVLFVTGELDDRTPIGNDSILSKEFREAIRVRVVNGGHELLVDRPVRELVTDFFLGRDVRDRSIQQAPPRFLSIEAAKLPPRRPGQ
jgi:pimeloyl-ACP methyl ester carboxylesterase